MKINNYVLMSRNEFANALWTQYPEVFNDCTIEQCNEVIDRSYDLYLLDNDPFAFGKGFDETKVDNREFIQLSLF